MGKTESTVRDRRILEEIGEEILVKMTEISNNTSRAFLSDGMIVVPVKYKDGAFKNKTIGAWEFFPNYAYVGARGELIFGLATADQVPEDGKPMWEVAEFTCKKLDDSFPMLLHELAKKFEITSKINLMSDLVTHLYNKRAVNQAMEMETAEEKMQANPMFGLF